MCVKPIEFRPLFIYNRPLQVYRSNQCEIENKPKFFFKCGTECLSLRYNISFKSTLFKNIKAQGEAFFKKNPNLKITIT